MEMKEGLGSEHPLCDKIQLLMVSLFFVVWAVDTFSYFFFGYSTVILQVLIIPGLLVGTLLFFGLSLVLVSKSHKAVLEQDSPQFVDTGVYAWIRHPLYLGTLLFCLGLIFISFSLVSIAILIIFFIFYDRMATFEEKNLVEILGERYVVYQKRVSKWLPMPTRNEENLPIKINLKLVYILSLFIAGLLVFTSVSGILLGSRIYPTGELFNNFISNDVVNIIIGLPVILASIILTLQGKLVGLLFWPGSLLFVIYNYMIYVLAMPLNWVVLLYLMLITLSVYTIIILVTIFDGTKIQQRLTGVVHERISGAILVAMGVLFMLQAGGAMIDSVINQIQITGIEFAVHIADFSISPILVIGGLLLWRRKEFGYAIGLGLLFQASMLFIGLIAFLIIQPLLTQTAFLTVDILVVSIMGLICFIPLALFIRGVIAKDNSLH
jgi:protein-S-isoprenylcysteine O-methyltransferase Ste14